MANTSSTERDGLLWALIGAGQIFMGRVDREGMQQQSSFRVEEALVVHGIPELIPQPNGMAEIYRVTITPVAGEEGPVAMTVLNPGWIMYFNDMSDMGAKYHRMRSQLLDSLDRARAQRLGIEVAQQTPKGGLLF